jgi:CDP-diacylglycerol--glycerol-3-phosphate 3-phosphatidyltransferase
MQKITTLANLISILRLLAALIFAVFFINSDYLTAFFIFLIAALSDICDGNLARLRRNTSQIGEVLDPIADKFLVITALYLIWQLTLLPLSTWMLFTILIREVGISILRIKKLIGGEKYYLSSFKWGKVKTVIQMLSVLVALLTLELNLQISTLLYYLFFTSTLVTIISGYEYIFKVYTYRRLSQQIVELQSE